MGRYTTRPPPPRSWGDEGDEDQQPVLDGTAPVPGPGLGREQLLGQGYWFGVDHDQPARQLVGLQPRTHARPRRFLPRGPRRGECDPLQP